VRADWPAGAGRSARRGIDVSKYQGEIEWQDISSTGISFAFLRASVGKTYVDPTYQENRVEARAWGIAAGAYHAAHPVSGQDAEAEARAEAEHFLAAAKPRPGDLRPVLDIELTKGPRKDELVRWLWEWLGTVEREVGAKPIIYTSPSFWHDVAGDSHEFADAGYPLWIAHYKDPTGTPTLPGGWKTYVFWQYSDAGKVPGIAASVDLDIAADDLYLHDYRLPPSLPNAELTLPPAFWEWYEWRRYGAVRAKRPRGAPSKIPKAWWTAATAIDDLRNLSQE
jgi:GH25 family lysozyme M1 (1,4-beta-N-acetylmuramidase)